MTETTEKTAQTVQTVGRLERDWTRGSIPRNLLSLAWPMVINESLWVVGTTVDMIWVGKLGSASIAGVGVGGLVVMLGMALRFGLTAGARAMIARFIGAGDYGGANRVAQQAFVVSGAYAVIVAVIGVAFAEPILSLVGVEEDVVREGAAYIRIQFMGSAAMSFWVIGEVMMYASADSVTPMKITAFARAVHMTLDPFLIFGWWIFPRLGVSGAAVANLVFYCVGLSLAAWVLFTGRTRLRLSLRGFRIDPGIIWRIIKIGVPASVMGTARILGRFVLMWVMVPFGTVAVACHTVAQRLEMVFYMPAVALGIAAGVLVGQNLGARQPERSEKSAWLAAGLVELIMMVATVAVLVWAEPIVRLFNSEPEMVAVGSRFIRIEATGYLFLGMVAVMQQSLSGAGDTLPPMVVSLVMIWVLQVPLAYLLPDATGLGVYAVRWAIVTGTFVGAAAYVIYFRRGRWKRKRI